MSLKRESPEEALLRWDRLAVLQREYDTFVPFLQDMMAELGFSTDEIQEDIADFLDNGPLYCMVQAQRSQAKSTITAIYAVYALMHDPTHRVLIISAGDRQANEISTLVTRLILHVDILEPLRPDRQAGDRTSVEAFDVHHSLKGVDKSPSVACMGVTANLQGARADLLIADDVESGKNSRTAVQRAQLLHITRDFVSINQKGRIIYLGTPQSIESIYNSLPSAGFTIRVWPGRVPTAEQLEAYKEHLAPMIALMIREHPEWQTGFGLDGLQGKATSPRIVSEDMLIAKELGQGPAYFQLQHMLLTALSDQMRFPLKTENLVVMRLPDDQCPITTQRGFQADVLQEINGRKYAFSSPIGYGESGTAKASSTVLYLDPAGGGVNADETGWACVGLMNSNLYCRGVGGVPGGYEPKELQEVADLVVRFKPQLVKIEQNFGYGAFKAVISPVIRATCEHHNIPMPAIVDDYAKGQKEVRIIEVLEPIMGRGALVMNSDIFEDERRALAAMDARVRDTYSLFFQMTKITREPGALIHDDRLDALAGACAHFQDALAVDQKKAVKAAEQRAYKEMMDNPLGKPLPRKPKHANMIAKSTGGFNHSRIRRI